MLNGARLNAALKKELRAAFEDTLESGRFVGGEAVASFETSLAVRMGVSHAIGTASGTDALLVALTALGVRAGDEIITSPYTFIATAQAAAKLGAVPVFADIDPTTFNIDSVCIRDVVTERTVGIVPVHLFGQCADMSAVLDVADTAGLWVLEDAAQAIGATWRGRVAGTMGTAGAFSFFPAKNLGALGDGGAVITRDASLADRMIALRNHGAKEKYCHLFIGGNHRLDALQAAFLSAKLPHLSRWQRARQRVADTYRRDLEDVVELTLPVPAQNAEHVYNQFVIRAKHRDALQARLAASGIETAIYYPRPLHLQPCFDYLRLRMGDFPQAERAAAETLALPMDPTLTEAEQGMIVDEIHSFYSKARRRGDAHG